MSWAVPCAAPEGHGLPEDPAGPLATVSRVAGHDFVVLLPVPDHKPALWAVPPVKGRPRRCRGSPCLSVRGNQPSWVHTLVSGARVLALPAPSGPLQQPLPPPSFRSELFLTTGHHKRDHLLKFG